MPGEVRPRQASPSRIARSLRAQWSIVADRDQGAQRGSDAAITSAAMPGQELGDREPAADQGQGGAQPGQERALVGQGEAVVGVRPDGPRLLRVEPGVG